MNRLDRYVISHVLQLTGIVALGLVAIYTLVVFVSDVNEAGKGDYGVLQVLEYSLLLIPGSLYTLMPIIALLGTLMGIGQLARTSELTAIRAAGVSLRRVGTATVIAGVFLGCTAFLLGDRLAPYAEHVAENLHDTAKGGDMSAARSIWLRDSDSIIRIGELVAEDHVRDLTVLHPLADSRLVSVATVEDAQFDGSHWQLKGVNRTIFGDKKNQVQQIAAQQLDGGLSPSVLKLFILKSDSLSVSGLLRLIAYLDDNHLDASSYRLSLWRKLVEPLTVVVMMLFAIPFVSGRTRDAGAGQRLLIGVLIGITFYVVNKVSVSLGDIYRWPPSLAASVPTIALTLIAVWRLQRTR